MNVVGISTNFYWCTFQVFANTAKIGMKLAFMRWMNERLPIFGAKNDVYVGFYYCLSHGFCVSFYPALSGLWILF